MHTLVEQTDERSLIVEHLAHIFGAIKGLNEDLDFGVDYSNGRYVLFYNHVTILEVSLDGIMYMPKSRRTTSSYNTRGMVSVPIPDSLPRLFYRFDLNSERKRIIEESYNELIKIGIENSYF